MAPGGVLDGADVLVEDGRVAAVGEATAGARELDARGCYVLPGGVDPHAHVYEGLAAAPAAALRSGTTTVEAYAPPRAGRARGGRVRALARPGHGIGLPHRAARDGLRARCAGRGVVRGARRPGRARHQAVPRVSRAGHGRRRRAPAACAASGAASTASSRGCTARTPGRSTCCASGCAPPAISASTRTRARARRSSRRRPSAACSTSRAWPRRRSTSCTSPPQAASRRSAWRGPKGST